MPSTHRGPVFCASGAFGLLFRSCLLGDLLFQLQGLAAFRDLEGCKGIRGNGEDVFVSQILGALFKIKAEVPLCLKDPFIAIDGHKGVSVGRRTLADIKRKEGVRALISEDLHRDFFVVRQVIAEIVAGLGGEGVE